MILAWIMPVHKALQTKMGINLTVDALVMFLLATPVQFWIGKPFFVAAYKAVRHKSANMDVLIVLGTMAAYVYSLISIFIGIFNPDFQVTIFFEISVLLITFVLFGRLLENIAKGKTSEALTKLLSLQADTAVVLTRGPDGEMIEDVIESKLIQKGDIVKVVPGERVPADGEVVFGHTSVDESMLTGESMPVSKRMGDSVIGGTINQAGLIHVKATKVGGDTALAQIIKLVEEAQTTKAPIQKFADRVSGMFVPAVVALATVTFLIWFILGISSALPSEWLADTNPFLFAFLKGIAVLVIAW
jgi:Cu+-exporting ATPase